MQQNSEVQEINFCAFCPKKNRAFISPEFTKAIRKSDYTQAVLAEKIGIKASLFSKILSGQEAIKMDDEKFIKLKELLEFRGEIFGVRMIRSQNDQELIRMISSQDDPEAV